MDRPREEHPLNADPAAQLRLLDLQDVDSELDRLAHRRRQLPEAARASGAAGEARLLRDRAVAARTRASDTDAELGRAEADVDQVRARAARDRALLESGDVASARQLEDLRRELESLDLRQAALEDVQLEVMERAEERTAEAADAGRAQADGEAALAEAEQALAAATADLDAAEAGVRARRAPLAGAVPADLLALYERLRADHGGTGAARLARGRCEGCRLELTPVDIARLRAAPPEEVLRCEECRRILVRTPESGLAR